ncbi:Spy/CpxP family protein refolding chaperone [uncultured Sunxiuqinia sp.]|uniref:Spy/CpxP family protein refolding chaperone n=1 Tax=Sunxiuqinia rutila TaxID=1397841 RepID=UPI002606A2D9|nr:Spy/CpxP family protein refolding chaperone [uncultured Sunxiuqinia sp.]
MKKLYVLLVVLVATIGASYAQPGGQRQRMSQEERDKRLIETLGLDDAQQKKLTVINKKYQKTFTELREQMQGASDEKRRELFPKMREQMESRNKEIRAMLTKEQAEKFDEMQKQRQERMNNRRAPGERGGARRPGK